MDHSVSVGLGIIYVDSYGRRRDALVQRYIDAEAGESRAVVTCIVIGANGEIVTGDAVHHMDETIEADPYWRLRTEHAGRAERDGL